MISIDIDDEQVVRSLNRYRRNISESRGLMRRLSFNLRDYVRDTIKQGGRKRPYAPLSQMTMLRTGRRKPLTSLVNSIKSSYTSDSVSVFFENPKGQDWTIEQHHKGFTIPAHAGRQGFFAARTGRAYFFMNSKAHRVPAREIIPTKAEVNSVISQAVRDWVHGSAS